MRAKLLLCTVFLLAACEEPAPTIVIEAGEVEYITRIETPDVDPMPVVVAPGFPPVDAHELAPVRASWRSRCSGGFMTTRGGVVLSCRM